MPWCPDCRSEYREGFDRCADCHVDLVVELPPEPRKPDPVKWVVVFAGDEARRTVVQAALESAGIQTFLPNEETAHIAPYHFAQQGFMFRVLVPSEDVKQAKRILSGEFRLPRKG